MATRFFGERIKRNQDPSRLTGRVLYVDDFKLPNMAHVVSVCSPQARTPIRGVDTSWTIDQEGAIATYTAEGRSG